ncbi:hypothetical protein BX285_6924 [Streptomyces sp. 1114.5]|uniref:hypothetical protein n=1 Tax=unclassified Streptomyces TaxID=2593676 RepID=UPI000BD3B9F9|nr:MULTISPECIES: hypothetical protein [unclassified Streptomyces]RKT09818.1 hypothetical protein BX285_6924 [Streptomyces sp. 1114.5]SOB88832.1 hypothetical protein SAMN06272789_7151 [Streptomyces sp. 1331.2]
MAEIVTEAGRLTVRLTTWERVEALHGDIAVPLAAVRSVSVEDQPLTAAHGMRAPGTSVPGVVKAGTWRSSAEGRQFVLAKRGLRAVRIELAEGEAEFDVLLVAVPDPEAVAAQVRAAAAL